VLIVMFAIPFIVIGCGYLVPKTGYVGIDMTTSGLGIAYLNVIVAFAGGAVTGALLSYWKKQPVHLLLGPLSGYVAGTPGFDVYKPWEMLIIALFAPLFVFAVHAWLEHRHIDESKIVPLGVGAGTFGALVVGFVAWGTPDGGFLGIKTGPYAFQHATITPYWQLLGIAVTVGIAVVSALVLVVGLEKTVGLRRSETDEATGLDTTYWGVPPLGSELTPQTPNHDTAPAPSNDKPFEESRL
jgi:ammonia channel protein AmtB